MYKFRALAVAAAALPLALLGPRAAAHAILVESTPAVNGVAAGPDVAFSLRYNSRIDKARSKVTLTKPDHSEERLAIDPDGEPDILTAKASLEDGSYRLRWQVLAIDGHITRGDVPFDVKHP
jgi:methionine-rich copper-binding protein CopC